MLPFEHCTNIHHALQLDAKPKHASHASALSTSKALVAALLTLQHRSPNPYIFSHRLNAFLLISILAV